MSSPVKAAGVAATLASSRLASLDRMEQRARRTYRSAGVAARARHHDLGSRHRRARGPRAADRLRRSRRDAAGHRRCLRGRRQRGGPGIPARFRRAPVRGGPRHEGRHRPCSDGGRSVDTSRRALLRSARRVAAPGSAPITSTCGRCTPGARRPRSRRPLRRSTRPSAVVAPATSASRTTRGGRQRTPRRGSAPGRAGHRSPAPRWSTPCSSAGSSARCSRPARLSASACSPGRRWAAGS